MICPRWLVQSSALGTFGAALVAIPLWTGFGPQDTEPESTWSSSPPVVEQADHTDVGISEAIRKARTNTASARDRGIQNVRTVRAVRIRYYPGEHRPAPQCRVSYEISWTDGPDTNRSDAPKSVWEPPQHDESQDWQRPTYPESMD